MDTSVKVFSVKVNIIRCCRSIIMSTTEGIMRCLPFLDTLQFETHLVNLLKIYSQYCFQGHNIC